MESIIYDVIRIRLTWLLATHSELTSFSSIQWLPCTVSLCEAIHMHSKSNGMCPMRNCFSDITCFLHSISILRPRRYHTAIRMVFACANEPLHKGTIKLIFSVVIDGQRRTHHLAHIVEWKFSFGISNRDICMRTTSANTRIFTYYIEFFFSETSDLAGLKIAGERRGHCFSWPFDLSWPHTVAFRKTIR